MSNPSRPGAITFLTVIGIIQGAFGALLGLFVIIDRNDDDFLRQLNDSDAFDQHQVTPNVLLSVGVIALALGVLTIVVSLMLSKGSHLARWLFAIAATANAAGGVYALIRLHGEQQVTGAFTLAFSILALWILFGYDRSEAFFDDRPA